MYTIYISKYKDGDAVNNTPICIYDNRSPAKDMFIVEPVVDLSDSKAGSVTFTMPPTHYMYDRLMKKITMVTVKRVDKNENPVIFEGFVTSAERDFYKNKTVFCEGFASFLNDSAQPAREYFDISLDDLVRKLVSIHNERMGIESNKTFSVGKVDAEFPELEIAEKRKKLGEESLAINTKVSPYELTQFDSTFAYLSNLQERCRAHLIFSKNPEGSERPYNIDFVKNLPSDPNAQPIVFGENMLDYADKYDASNLCTAVLPIASADSDYGGSKIGDVVMIEPDIIVSTNEQKDSLILGNMYGGHLLSENSIVHVESEMKFYKVILVDDGFIFSPLAGRGRIHYCALLKRIENLEYDYTISFLENHPNGRGYDLKIFSEFIFFPEVGSSDYYYRNKADAKLYNWNGSSYVEITDSNWKSQVDGYVGYHVFEYYPDSSINHLYLSTRSHMLYEETDGLYYIGIENAIGLGRMTINKEGWTSIADYDVDLMYESAGAEFYGANRILLAGWGGSLPTVIKRDAYSYKTKDYSIGDDYTCYIFENSVIEFREDVNRYVTVTDDTFGGFRVFRLDVSNMDYVYISTRTQNGANGCLWYLLDGSDQQLTYEKYDDGGPFTSRIYYKIDLTKPETKGGVWLYFGVFGDSIPPKATQVLKTTGLLESYMTVEGANEYSEIDPKTGELIFYHRNGSLYVESEKLIEKYGRIERKVQFNYIDNPDILVNKGVDYLLKSQYDDLEIQVTGCDLHSQNIDISSYEVSTMIPVISQFHGIDKEYPVMELKLRLDSPEDSTLKMGETKTLEDRINEGSEVL